MDAIKAYSSLMSRGNSATIRWIHLGVEGNEVADPYAKGAAESALYAVDRAYLRQTTLAHMTRLTTEARASARAARSSATSEDAEAIGH